MSNEHDNEKSAPSGGGINPGVAVIGMVLTGLAGAGLMWGIDQQKAREGGGGSIVADAKSGGPAWEDDGPIPVSSKDPMWGNRNAPVTIAVFSDFQCPYCSRVEASLDKVKTTYGPDKVRIFWKNEPLPFHPNAKPAGEAAQGVLEMKGPEAFWKFHATAFKNQQALNEENYVTWAKEAGVTDVTKFRAGLTTHKWLPKVEKDHELAKSIGVNGTPASYINGVAVSGAQPFEKFKEIIDSQLTKASQKVASGTAKDKVYAALTKEQFKKGGGGEEDGEEEKEDTKTVNRVPVGNSPVMGNPKALVTIAVFSDFQCPFCKKVEPTFKQIRETYGDKVRVMWKNEPLPFHPRAIPAANLALEARAQKGDAGFWAAHDKLFEIHPKLEDADLEAAAKDLGLNVGKVMAAIKDNKYERDIDADMELAEDVAASGTPHMFVNGRRLVGAQPFEKFKTIIDEEIIKANKLIASGTPADKVYDELMKSGKAPPEVTFEKKTVAAPPASSPFKGGANAKVTIQVFSDFQCPFCSKVEPTLAKVHKNYGDKVKIIWRDKPLPMHADAPLASEAAREAMKQKGPDGFWKMHAKLFANQTKLKRENLDEYAKDLKLDEAKFKAALDNHTHKAVVDAEMKAGDDADIKGTPAMVINGYFINGAQPYAKFRKVIDKALAEAK
jgi:protein-disulfide isomerase